MLTRLTVIIVSILLFAACNKSSSPAFDFSKQPHQDTVPAVVGRWFEQPQSVTIDPVVYPAPDFAGAIPEYVSSPAAVDTTAAVGEVISWLKPHGLTYTMSQTADITVKLYYAPWTGSKVVSSLGGEYRGAVEVSEKSASAAMVPPRATSDYFGLTQMQASQKRYKSATVWINVFPYADFKAQGVDWKANGKAVTQRIVWHEMMHTVGLNDDPTGKIPGLMVYRNMTARPNAQEVDVIDWLYPRTN